MILLVSLAIGPEYLEQYRKKFMTSHENYANKCGYDFHVLTYYPEAPFMEKDYPRNYNTISLHKILVCSQDWSDNYDMIIFVDADILIHKDAPPIHACMDFGDKIGIVDEFSQPSYAGRIELQKRMGWETSGKEYYALCGFDLDSPHVLNTGVLVFQPRKHRQLLEAIFKKYIYICEGHPRGFIFEQTAIGYELIQNNSFLLLPNQYNQIWALEAWTNTTANLYSFYNQTWFLHFAGKVDIDKVEDLVASSEKNL